MPGGRTRLDWGLRAFLAREGWGWFGLVWLVFGCNRRNLGVPDKLEGIPGVGKLWASRGAGQERCLVD